MAETTVATPTVDENLSNKILKQVEYYFSDSNFIRDKFLRAESAKNPDGFISIDTIASFNRMKELSTDLQLITDILKKSSRLVVDQDGKMIKRKDPLPENIESEKTLYSKGWPLDTTIEKVEQFFSQFGKVLSVRLRKKQDKSFKGSLHVDFETEDIVTKIIADAPKLDGDKELLFQTYKQFITEKKEEKEKFLSSNPDKKRKATKDLKDETEQEEKEQEEEDKMVTGTILTFAGVGENLHRGNIKEIFSQYGEVLFVGFNTNDTDGNVRFKTADSATRAMEGLTAEKKEFGGKVPTYKILDGEDEKKEWDKIFEMKKNASGKGGKGGKFGKGGKGGKFGKGGKGKFGNKKAKRD
ncbi:hypothetical protein CYY_002208 [Polysphondylium violaceum]|uniref:Lupus La protein n=1 Tax=Polysphondylium violaceum TaxID=133409 RepID=A0A8J4V333_9MYCE|nr:hypothetical protein CYY_002208 [Polysphondylium violaceum]